MNNLAIGLKRFFTNKNVVTILLVLVALALLFWGYTSTIKKETNPINVPVAAQKINPKTQITQEMVSYKEVAGSMVDEKVLTNSWEIIDKYSNVNVTIPEGSVFYADWVVDKGKIPGKWIEELDREKELPFYMSVDMEKTLGNAIMPDSYVDFYLKAVDENNTIMFGRFMKDVKILVVHDGSGNDIFADNTEIGEPSKLGFAVSQDYYMLLSKASFLDLEMVLVPRGSVVPNKCEGNCMMVTSSTLRDYIDAKTITVEEDVIVEKEEEKQKELQKNQTQQNGDQTNNPTPAQQ